MSMMKKTLVMLLALITACGMLATGVFAQEMPEDAASSEGESAATEEAASPAEQAPAAEAAEEQQADPIEGSWILNAVYELKEGAEPELLKKEENQSLYGVGIGIYTFEDGGYGHYNMIESTGDNMDEEASWESPEPDVYNITETTGTVTMKYVTEEDSLHKTFQEEDRVLDFVYARAIVGSWQLQQVLEIHEGDAPDELSKEENQSLYAEDESILTFFADGKAQDEVKEGPNAYKNEGTWEMTKPDFYVFTEDGLEMGFSYFRVDDTLLRDVKDSAPDAVHPYLQFIYVRVETEEAPGESEGESADSEGGSATEAAPAEAAPAAPAEEVTPLNKTMYCTSQIGANVRSGGSTDDGVIGLIEYRGAVNVTGKVTKDGKDTGWLQVNYNGQTGYMHSANLSDTQPAAPQPAPADDPGELIADGQIFTGHTMYLYAPEGGGVLFEAHELTDGRWANPDTGVTYEQEGGGGYHFYGSDGSVWVTEAYFAEFPVGSNGLD